MSLPCPNCTAPVEWAQAERGDLFCRPSCRRKFLGRCHAEGVNADGLLAIYKRRATLHSQTWHDENKAQHFDVEAYAVPGWFKDTIKGVLPKLYAI